MINFKGSIRQLDQIWSFRDNIQIINSISELFKTIDKSKSIEMFMFLELF